MPAPDSLRVVCLVSLLLASATLGAQTTYRWIDPATGRTVLSDLPPPAGAKRVDRSSPSFGDEAPPTQALPYAVRQASEKFPVVLYTNPGCTTCKQARSLLDGRGVPFVEKELGTAEELAAPADNSAARSDSPASASAGKTSKASHPLPGTNFSTRPDIRPAHPTASSPPARQRNERQQTQRRRATRPVRRQRPSASRATPATADDDDERPGLCFGNPGGRRRQVAADDARPEHSPRRRPARPLADTPDSEYSRQDAGAKRCTARRRSWRRKTCQA